MNRFLKNATLLAALIGAIGSTANAGVIVDKTPNTDPPNGWWPLSTHASYVYANSFIFTAGATGSTMTTVGMYMHLENDFTGNDPPNFVFQVFQDNGNSPTTLLGPTILGTTAALTVPSFVPALVTAPLISSISLTFGTRYWIAASTVGQSTSDMGEYRVRQHVQNSIYNDNGTFWFSNDPLGINFDGQNVLPEIAIYAEGDLRPIRPGVVPEPASLTIWGLGLIGCAVAVRRRRRLAA